MRLLKIWWHKHQARKAYSAFLTILTESEAGINMTWQLKGDELRPLVDKFNRHMDALAKLDPETPKGRLAAR